jgi:asparagine synthase (glutamine-hydrolysing)
MALLKIQFNNNTEHSIQDSSGIKKFTTENTNVYVFGNIQHHWYTDDSTCINYFNEQQYSDNFYQNLNGHFSLVIIEKNTNKVRLVANRSGGFRLYIKIHENQLSISNHLTSLKSNENEFNQTALSETLNFRWNSGESSLLNGILQLPSACYWDFSGNELSKKVCYQYFPVSNQFNTCTNETKADDVEKILSQSLHEAITPGARVAVLLSGGVDSSVLAALAKKHQSSLVAISHRSDDHQNPELETAIQFAKELGIEHKIYTINNCDILDAFTKTIEIIEQPARYQSSLLLYKLFEHMAGKFDQIIYGEAADTLFGSSLVKRFHLRQKKQKRLLSLIGKIPFTKQIINLLPSTNKIKTLLNENYHDYMMLSSQLEYSGLGKEYINNINTDSMPLSVVDRLVNIPDVHKINPDNIAIASIKSFLMRTDRDNHFHETGALAAHFDMELVSPFVDAKVIAYAATIDDKSYYGSDYVKPILREIGAKYFTPSLMYITKKGFPAPYESWIEGPLKQQREAAEKAFELPEDKKNNHEFQWTIICLYQHMKNFNIPFSNLRRN